MEDLTIEVGSCNEDLYPLVSFNAILRINMELEENFASLAKMWISIIEDSTIDNTF